jgi:hypothetical protein
MYYSLCNRHDKFPGGESLDDLAQRADKVIDETVWPHVEEALKSGGDEELNIVVVSHGLTISEMVSACKSLLPLLLGQRVDSSLITSTEKESGTSTEWPFVQGPRKYRMDAGSNRYSSPCASSSGRARDHQYSSCVHKQVASFDRFGTSTFYSLSPLWHTSIHGCLLSETTRRRDRKFYTRRETEEHQRFL